MNGNKIHFVINDLSHIFEEQTIRFGCQHIDNRDERSFRGKIWQLSELHINDRWKELNMTMLYTNMPQIRYKMSINKFI